MSSSCIFFAFVMLWERRFGYSVSCADQIIYRYAKGMFLTHRQVDCIPILVLFYSVEDEKIKALAMQRLKDVLIFFIAQFLLCSTNSFPTKLSSVLQVCQSLILGRHT